MSATKASTVSTTSLCPECGGALPQVSLQGLCPRCVARQAADILAARTGAVTPTLSAQAPTHLRYFGDYELLEEIAHGGMGVVWKARQISLNRIVAVKLLLAGKFSSPEFVQRFRAEAEAAANLQHPNIVAIHEVGAHEGHQYFSMDYVEGQNLAQLAREQPLPARRAAALLKTVAEAVHYAHQKGIVHRDLKPANILLDQNDRPRVTDFGLAKRLDDSQLSTINNQLTLTGQVLGTPAYTSPEQAGGKRGEVGPLTDVYSLGAVLYFLLTSRAPFVSDTLEETLRQVHEIDPVSPRLLNPAVPRDLETICLKCLTKDPRRRYDSAQVLADDLGRFLNNEPIHSRPVSNTEKILRWCRRKPALAALTVALLLVGVTGLVGILWQWRRAETNADSAQQHAARETTERHRAEEAVTMLELQRAEDLLEKDQITTGVAYLARMVRQQPTNDIAARRLLSALTQRNFALPVGLPLHHNKRLRYAEFSPDGSLVATASLDCFAGIWNARTSQLIGKLKHSDEVRFVHFSPDGTRLLTVADDLRARLWDVASQRMLGQPMPHVSGNHDSTQFSPDGRRVLTLPDDGTARIWYTQTGEPALQPLRHQGRVSYARFSPDGNRIVTASDDTTVQLWDASSGERIGRPFQHRAAVWHAEFAPNGKWLLTLASDRSAWSAFVWQLDSGEALAKPANHSDMNFIGVSPEGERITTGCGPGIIEIWNARDWTSLASPIRHHADIWAAEFSPEGERILTGSLDDTARVWNAATGEALTPPLEHDDMICSARFSSDGLFVVTASGDQTARIWDVRLGATRSSLLPAPAREVLAQEGLGRLPLEGREAMVEQAHWAGPSFSPDGVWMATCWGTNAARIWNTRTSQPVVTLSGAGRVILLRFSPDGQRLATFSEDLLTRLWDVGTGTEIANPVKHPGWIGELKFSPDGQWLAGGCSDKTLRQWNVLTGELRGAPISQRARIQFFSFSPDGQRLLISDFKDDMVQVFDASSSRLLGQTPPREGRVLHADFSPDGKRLITASEDNTARIWNTQTWQPLTAPLVHKGSVRCAKFSHDGCLVVTASEDGTARVWNSESGAPIGEPMNHRGIVCSAAFSPNDALLVTGSYDRTARLWDTKTGRPIGEPFPHLGGHVQVRFSLDGRRALTVSEEDGPRAWDVPPTIDSTNFQSVASATSGRQTLTGSERAEDFSLGQAAGPAVLQSGRVAYEATLLADLAEAIIGKRVNGQSALESVPGDSLGKVREQLAALSPRADFTRWLEWFFADRGTRTISPYSAVTMPQYVQYLTTDTHMVSWREALVLAPTNAPVLARVAEMLLTAPSSNTPLTIAQAQFLMHRAETLAPKDPTVLESRKHIADYVNQNSNR